MRRSTKPLLAPAPQMELHLQEMSAELAERLPEASLAQLDELAAQLEEVEEKLAGLKVLTLRLLLLRAAMPRPPCAAQGMGGRSCAVLASGQAVGWRRCCHALGRSTARRHAAFTCCRPLAAPCPQGREAGDAEVDAAEQRHADLQWRRFGLLTERAADSERRSYRSLLFNLRTQRQLLRQVSARRGRGCGVQPGLGGASHLHCHRSASLLLEWTISMGPPRTYLRTPTAQMPPVHTLHAPIMPAACAPAHWLSPRVRCCLACRAAAG